MAVTSLDDLIGDAKRRSESRPALAWAHGALSWSELDSTAGRLADTLARVVGPGQRIAVLSPNVPALIAALLAIWKVQAVAVPLNVRWRAYELDRVLRDGNVSAILAVRSYQGFDLAGTLTALRPSLPTLRRVVLMEPSGAVADEGPDYGAVPTDTLGREICAVLYTSGTTGEPKGALVTHRREVDGACTLAEVLRTTRSDTVVFVVPIAHGFGLTTCLAAMATAATIVLVDSSFSLGPLADTIGRHRATVLHGSPTLFAGLQKLLVPALRSLRTGFMAGASTPPGLVQALEDAGLQVLNLYGMTEIGAASCCRPEDPPPVRYTTVGRPLPGYAFEPAGEVEGELRVQGPYVTPGYYRRPNETAAAFDNGWFRTGDLGSVDAEGCVRVSGRVKDVIQVGGLNVSPAEVEGLLLTHPDVVQAAVIGSTHPVMGETLAAFVVPREGSGLTARDLLAFARFRIAGYKLPYSIHMLPELPMLATGKPDRAALVRRMSENHHAAGR